MYSFLCASNIIDDLENTMEQIPKWNHGLSQATAPEIICYICGVIAVFADSQKMPADLSSLRDVESSSTQFRRWRTQRAIEYKLTLTVAEEATGQHEFSSIEISNRRITT